MKLDRRTKRNVRIQSTLFYVLLAIVVVLLAQLSAKNTLHADWTANSRHSLSQTTKQFLKQNDLAINLRVFISPASEYKPTLESLLDRYQRYNDKLVISYIDPDFSPELVRQFNIQQQGEMVISHREKQQRVYDLSEQSLTNALIAVSRQKEQWLVFIEGHGERSPLHQANFNLSIWGDNLQQKGFKLQSLNLIEQAHIPDNTAVLIIASPEKPWLAGEVERVKEYINKGGHLLWLSEPDSSQNLLSLAESLGLEFLPGTVVDPNTELLGINDPRFALITDYAQHPVAAATSTVTLFPQSSAIQHKDNDWRYTSLLTTADNVWSDIASNPSDTLLPMLFEFEAGVDIPGPLTIGYLLSKPVSDPETDHEQRIAVIGDGDFLSNSYIGNGANLELGLALINWLAEDDALISIPIKTTLDNQLELSPQQSLYIGLGFLMGLPTILFMIGLAIWWYRRRQ